MKNLKNNVSLIGRLGAEPEITTLSNGRKLARFTLATNESYKAKSGEYVKDTQWHIINAWGKTADLVQKLLQKGQEVILDGKLVHQSYETKSGEKRNTTVIEINEFLLLNSKSEQKSTTN